MNASDLPEWLVWFGIIVAAMTHIRPLLPPAIKRHNAVQKFYAVLLAVYDVAVGNYRHSKNKDADQ